MFPEHIETERLLLRKPRQSDAPSVFANYARDPEVTRFLLWDPHRDVSETHGFLSGLLERWKSGVEAGWVITERGDPSALGMISARFEGCRADVGYVLSRSRWGRGYMSEALGAVVETCLAREGVWRVWAYCDVDNPASARVMEKAGMLYEGTLRRWAKCGGRDPSDCRVYAAVR